MGWACVRRRCEGGLFCGFMSWGLVTYTLNGLDSSLAMPKHKVPKKASANDANAAIEFEENF